MGLEFRYDGNLLAPERVQLTGFGGAGVGGLPSAAFNGEVGTAGVRIEDPDGDLTVVGLRPFTVDETDCDKPRIFTGWMYGRSISRGAYRTGPGRVWNCDIVDQNFAWGLKVFRASSAKRPAESDNVRMRFMLESAPMAATPIYDNGLFNTTDNPVNFGPADYVGQYPVELAASVAGTSGKNFYAYWDDVADEISAYYDQVSAVNRTSALTISNVIADVLADADTYYPHNAEMTRTPENTNSGILFGYLTGYVYGQRQETIDDHIDRDLVVRSDRVGKEATAQTLLESMLISRSVEQDTITCTIRVPSSKVNHALAGEWIDSRFTHLPDLDPEVQLPIIRRVVRTTARRDRYDIDLEMSTRAPEQGPGNGGVVVVPHRPCGATTGDYVQHVDGAPSGTPEVLTLPGAPTVGNTLVAFGQVRNAGKTPNTPVGWTNISGIVSPHETNGAAWYRYVESGDTATIEWPAGVGGEEPPELAYVGEYLGQLNIEDATLVSTDPYLTNSPWPGAAITPTSGLPGTILGYWFAKRDHGNLNANTGWTLRDAQTVGAVITHAVIEQHVTSSSGTYTPSFTGANPAVHDTHSYGAITLALMCGSGGAPATTQPILGETVTMVGAVGTTAYGYIDGSLKVRVDGLLISPASYTETDSEAGTFTLSWTPDSDEVVTVDYLAA
jgi:hypothetical protein